MNFIENETWKPVEGYEGLYEVSNLGRVKSYQHCRNGKILSLCDNGHGYLIVDLCKNGKKTPARVNRLVAIAFIPNPLGLPEVNHKDENKLNNRADNLEWCDGDYNKGYGNRNAKISATQRNDVKKSKPVEGIDPITRRVVCTFPSTREAERQGYNHGHIYTCCRDERKTHRGLLWRYKA